MKTTTIECPHCQSKNTNTANKNVQILFGIGMAIVGLGFLAFAATTAVGYYLFALPLLTVGGIRAFKGRYSSIADAHCHDCKKEFEYVRERDSHPSVKLARSA